MCIRDSIEGYRNFGTKLWNATRFCQMNGCARAAGFDPAAVKSPLNRWIVGETVRTAQAVTAALADCGFDEAASALYRFIWNRFCDWYVELAKPVLNGADEAARDETRATAAWVLDVVLKLLHPVMPFLTEELWAQTADLGAPRPHQGFLCNIGGVGSVLQECRGQAKDPSLITLHDLAEGISIAAKDTGNAVGVRIGATFSFDSR